MLGNFHDFRPREQKHHRIFCYQILTVHTCKISGKCIPQFLYFKRNSENQHSWRWYVSSPEDKHSNSKSRYWGNAIAYQHDIYVCALNREESQNHPSTKTKNSMESIGFKPEYFTWSFWFWKSLIYFRLKSKIHLMCIRETITVLLEANHS